MNAERRTTQPGTARKPALRNRAAFQPFGRIDLVPPHRFAGTAGNHAHVIEAERQQHGLLEPLIDMPLTVRLALGDARLAGIQ